MIRKIVKYLLGFTILCLVLVVCNLILKITNIPLPAPILGIILLFLLMFFKMIKSEWIKDISEFLLKIMPLLFIPFLVGIVSHYNLIEKNILSLFFIVFITTTLTIVITAFFVENIIKFIRLKKLKESKND